MSAFIQGLVALAGIEAFRRLFRAKRHVDASTVRPNVPVRIYEGLDGYFIAEVPSMPGCISQGKTHAEAVRNITEAIELYLDDTVEEFESVARIAKR